MKIKCGSFLLRPPLENRRGGGGIVIGKKEGMHRLQPKERPCIFISLLKINDFWSVPLAEGCVCVSVSVMMHGV